MWHDFTRISAQRLLGNYLKISPDAIEFEYSDCGKPRLAASMNNSFLQFNVSHSLDYAMYAFTNNHLIGVDLEFLREMRDATELAKRFFTHREFQSIANIADEERQKAFFQLWTAKEACLKAIGTGLSDSLDNIKLSFDRTNYPKLLAIKGDIDAVTSWSLYFCIPTANYIGAIAIDTHIPKQQISFWTW